MTKKELTINVFEYLTEDKISQIAEEELRLALRRQLKTRNDCEDFISNLAYDIAFEEVQRITGESLESIRKDMADTIMNIINDEKSMRFELFRDYGHKKAVAQEVIECCVLDSYRDGMKYKQISYQ